MRGLHDLVAVREESCFTLPKVRGSGCHWEEKPFLRETGRADAPWPMDAERPDSREGGAGGDAQVRRPACHVCHEATRNWLARNARGTRAFGSAERVKLFHTVFCVTAEYPAEDGRMEECLSVFGTPTPAKRGSFFVYRFAH